MFWISSRSMRDLAYQRWVAHGGSTAIGVLLVDRCVICRVKSFNSLSDFSFRSRNMLNSRDNQGSTRLPPLPMPSFPRFNQSNYQPNRMTYDELPNFRYEDTYSNRFY